MKTREIDGIIYVEEPEKIDYYEFSYEHLGCDSIVDSDVVVNPEKVCVYAYARTKQDNRKLKTVYEKEYNDDKYLLMRNMSERQAMSIV